MIKLSPAEFKKLTLKDEKTTNQIEENLSKKKIPKKKHKEENYLKILFKNKDIVLFDFYFEIKSMNAVISNNYQYYIQYKSIIHLLAHNNKLFFNNIFIENPEILILPYRKPKNILDKDNLISGMKPLIDTFHQDFKITTDDNIKSSNIIYLDQKKDLLNKTRILIFNKNKIKEYSNFYFQNIHFFDILYFNLNDNIFVSFENNIIEVENKLELSFFLEVFDFFNYIYIKELDLYINVYHILSLSKEEIIFKNKVTIKLKNIIDIRHLITSLSKKNFYLENDIIKNIYSI